MTITVYGIDQTPALNQLVRSTAHSADCPWGVFYWTSESNWSALACFGMPRPAALDPDSVSHLRNALSQTDLLAINDTRAETALMLPGLRPPGGREIRFIAAVPVKGRHNEILGALLIADHEPHAGLSAAQRYVLHTHAVQLAFRLDAHNVHDTPSAPSPVISERLRLLESVVVHANDAVLITEAEPIELPGPRIVYCNAAFTRTTGYSEAEVLGKTPRLLQNEQTNRQALDRLKAALRKWQPVEVELLNTRRDGSEFWVELSIVPVADERGWFTHWVSVQRDISERKQAEEISNQARIAQAEKLALEAKLLERQRIEATLSYAAFHDDLTKLYNRAFVMDRLNKVLSRKHGGKPLQATVLFLDLDRFKLVNDSLGHRAGDLLLMEVARRLESCLRGGDTLARVGGDEFVIVVEGEEHDRVAVQLAQEIIDQLQTPFRLSDQDIFTSCSIGIVGVSEEYTTPEELLRDADVAMYAAKAHGTGNFTPFTGSMRTNAVEALSLQNDLKNAIAQSEFSLHYQPIYDSLTGALWGVESLIRWHHPQRGLVSPATFIPIAEEIGVIREIGRWVMDQACKQLQAWTQQYPELELHLSVNVSARELKQYQFIAEVQSILETSGFPANRLQIEVTENVFLHDPALVGQVLEKLRSLDVQVALDDFGTEYSSLGYIDKYQIDSIKIDRSFVLRMLTHRRTMAIVQSILGLGQALDVKIVAEGVETQAQLDMLKAMGCPYVQGFLLARPMPPQKMAKLLLTLAEGYQASSQ
ncbi:diguanylate phosphodiesterase [Salinicola sp. MH3R3-1]|uniref:putative bifunctional diguanylate cyclase/phosphodiesterase n=1 Tax=Salinicola sp. MH3R3-1 TaxID=1928762 RepID=UPI00094E0EDC|nr:EAL domain-containing protein [Salinicola sp. MH3R3-1]OLO08497.1 diguanylate phosphodiesterase [Salinicola sp. MH3R3-1]